MKDEERKYLAYAVPFTAEKVRDVQDGKVTFVIRDHEGIGIAAVDDELHALGNEGAAQLIVNALNAFGKK